MDVKGLRVEIKDADKGEIAAIFSTFEVMDSDRDVTKSGAFTDGAEMPISAYGHTSWMGALPVGKGRIRTTAKEAILEGRFFLDTVAGRDTFTVVKELGPLGQWSYGYDVTKESRGEHEGQRVRFLEGLKVHEVSPVLLGAGVGTRTLTAKSGTPMSFAEEARAVLAAVTGLGDRAADVLAKRLEKGKGLGAESASLLEQVQAELKRFGELLTPEPEDGAAGLEREWLRMVARNLAKERH